MCRVFYAEIFLRATIRVELSLFNPIIISRKPASPMPAASILLRMK